MKKSLVRLKTLKTLRWPKKLSVVMSNFTLNNKKHSLSSDYLMPMMNKFDVQVNDYVRWHHYNKIDEGWVYFKCDDYVTIEVGVKPKPYCNVVRNTIHCNDHILVVCHSNNWHELEYIKTRETNHEDSKCFIRTISVDRPSSHG